VLGSPERFIGRVEVMEVEESYSVAKGVEGSAFERNNLLRLHHKPANLK